jgi:aspartate/methionine/tyrosine aminotransferase
VRRAIADRLNDLHGVRIDPMTQVMATTSGMTAIALAYQATASPGDSVIVITPCWPNLGAAARVAGAKVIEIPLSFSEQGFQLDFDRIERAIQPDTKVLALASPGNPTGWTATLDDWKRLVALCQRHDLWLLADGAYERIVFEGRCAPSPLSLPDAADHTIVVQTMSKAYRMTGWRVGYAVGPAEVARVMSFLQEYVVSHAPGITQEAARVALEEGEAFVAESQRRYARHQRLTLEHLQGIEGVQLPRPSGAFYVFPRMVGLMDSFGFCEWLVKEHRLGLAPGSAFGTGGEGHIRLCFAVEEDILRDALSRLTRAWTSYRKGLSRVSTV